MAWTTNRRSLARAAGGLVLAAGLAPACTAPTESLLTYTVGGTVSGLAGSGLVLRDNDGDDLGVTANGPVVFATRLPSGASYSVTVLTQPTGPAQTCTVTNGGSGTMSNANVTAVAIACVTNAYTVGGTISGLAGSGLVLRNKDGDDLPVYGNGPVAFATPVASGTAYGITVFAQPSDPDQSCVVTGGSGTVTTANVTTVAIACVTNAATVGGRVYGLVGAGLVLRNNGGDDLSVTANGSVVFATPLSSGATYDVTVFAQPITPAQTCVVTDGSGTMSRGTVTTVIIACVTNAGMGAVRVTASTIGPFAPATYTVGADPGSSSASTADVPANGIVSFPMAPGTHTVSLTVPSNCTVTRPNILSVTVASGRIADIAFRVTCVAKGTLRVTVATTGPDAPASYTVFVDPSSFGASTADVPADGTASFAVASGDHTVYLQVARNCTVTSSNSVAVTVTAGAPTDVAFSVTCGPLGTIQVTVATTGINAPATFVVQARDVWYYDRHTAFVPSNGTMSFPVLPGSYAVTLLVPRNCTVASPNNVSVTLTSGATTHLAFTVACQ